MTPRSVAPVHSARGAALAESIARAIDTGHDRTGADAMAIHHAALFGWALQRMAMARGYDPRSGPPLTTDASVSEQTVEALGSLEWAHLTPNDLGVAHQLILARSTRRAKAGAFYTPPPLVEHLIDAAVKPALVDRLHGVTSVEARREAILSTMVCDPACGCGHFLVAAAHRLAKRIAGRRGEAAHADAEIIAHCIFGVDRDPIAVDLCRWNLWFAAGGEAEAGRALGEHVRVGDALHSVPPGFEYQGAPRLAFRWAMEFPRVFNCDDPGFDVVIGNPPFLNQLATTTARDTQESDAVRAWAGEAVRPYTDPSALFVLLSARLTRRGGRLALVQPQSFLAARDAAGVRRELAARGSLESLWVANAHAFAGASVLTCAFSMRIGGPRQTTLQRACGLEFATLQNRHVDMDHLAAQETWAHLAAAAAGVPEVTIPTSPTLRDIADATADFRDQYYGLLGHLIEDDELTEDQRVDVRRFPRLVTAGLIDLAQCRWGERTTRVLKHTWRAPRVDRAALDSVGDLSAWVRTRLTPKVLVATQTSVIETWVDVEGATLPCTPVLTVTPLEDGDDLWRIAAAIASPVASVWGMTRYGGTALSAQAIKLSARQLLGVPLPLDEHAWADAAHALREAHEASDTMGRSAALQKFGHVAVRGHRLAVSDAERVLAWWWARVARGGRRVQMQPRTEREVTRSA